MATYRAGALGDRVVMERRSLERRGRQPQLVVRAIARLHERAVTHPGGMPVPISRTQRFAIAGLAAAVIVVVGLQSSSEADHPATAPDTAVPGTGNGATAAPTTVALRIAITDDRSPHRRTVDPMIWSRPGGSWYVQFEGDGEVRDIGGFRRGDDTLLIFARGRDQVAVRVPLRITDSICANACVRDMTQISLRDNAVEVNGSAVSGFTMRSATGGRGLKAPPPGELIRRSDLGVDSPLTVDSGWLDCVAGDRVVFRTRSATYALNGSASSYGYTPIDPIWRTNPHIEGTRINIGPLIKRGLATCQRALR